MRDFIRLVFIRRFRRIILLVVVFALQFWWLGKRRRFMSPEEQERSYRQLYRWQAERFTTTAISMGGLLIKLGQFFSSRVDILPQEYTDRLTELQDAVQPVDSGVITARVEEELGPISEAFASFTTEALAAASLGQVHRAVLNSGEQVAVKILRPGIEEIIAIDLQALRVVLNYAKRYPQISSALDLDMVYREFGETVTDELDYDKEGHNAEWFKENFAADSRIYIPWIDWSHSTKKVLTMEFIEGIKINEFAALDRAGLDRGKIAETLVSAYLQQVLVDGFFHADPHPGNILIRDDGTLVFIDFGMVGFIDQEMKDAMVDLALGAVRKDTGAIVEAFDRLHFLRPNADRGVIIKSVRLMLADLFGDTSDLENLDFSELASEFRDLIYNQPFQIPARTTFLGKTAVTVVGLCIGLDNNFDAMKIITPYMKRVFSLEDGGGWQQVWEQVKRTVMTAVSVPEKIDRFIDGVESGELRFHPARSFEDRLLEHQSLLTGRIVSAVLASGFLISGTQLLQGPLAHWGIALLVAAGLCCLTLLRRSRPARVFEAEEMKRMVAGDEEIAPGLRHPRLRSYLKQEGDD